MCNQISVTVNSIHWNTPCRVTWLFEHIDFDNFEMMVVISTLKKGNVRSRIKKTSSFLGPRIMPLQTIQNTHAIAYTKYCCTSIKQSIRIDKVHICVDRAEPNQRKKININNKLRKPSNKFSNCQNSNGMIYAQILIIEDFRSFAGSLHFYYTLTCHQWNEGGNNEGVHIESYKHVYT